MSPINTPIPAIEWEEASCYFKQNPRTILRPNSSQQDIKNIAHTFIDFGGIQVACDNNKKTKNLGEGTFGEVVLAYDQANNPYAVKIQKRIPEYLIEDQQHYLKLESEITEDLKIGIGMLIFEGKNKKTDKFYSLQHYLGESLGNYLINNIKKMNDQQRWNLAILLCLELAKLHTGLLSKNYTRYAHLDIKPGNIVIDDKEKPHLVDFGLSEKMCWNNEMSTKKSTRVYQSLDYFKKNKIYVDTFALKRTLYLPTAFTVRCSKEDMQKYHVDSYWDEKQHHGNYTKDLIIEEEVKNDDELKQAIDTTTGLTRTTTSAALAATLLQAKHRAVTRKHNKEKASKKRKTH